MTREQYEQIRRSLLIAQGQCAIAELDQLSSKLVGVLIALDERWARDRPAPMTLPQEGRDES